MIVANLLIMCYDRLCASTTDTDNYRVLERYMSNIRNMCIDNTCKSLVDDWAARVCDNIVSYQRTLQHLKMDNDDLRDFYTFSKNFDVTKIEQVVSSMRPKDYLDKCIICCCICYHVYRRYEYADSLSDMLVFTQNYIDGWSFGRTVFGMCGLIFNLLCLRGNTCRFDIFGNACVDMYVDIMPQAIKECMNK